MSHPYIGLPARQYWRTGVAESHPFTVEDLYHKKFEIRAEDRIATAGSCFAQHVSTHMKRRGYNIIDVEPPAPGMTDATAKKYGYSIYSGRFGNIYTARQLVQLMRDCERGKVRDEDIWEKDGRFYDGLRPGVEPAGLSSAEEVRLQRKDHLARVKAMFSTLDVMIFTLGLTEGWVNVQTGTTYPTCPGVMAGTFDPQAYAFKNFTHAEILEDLKFARDFIKKRNANARILFTVSPVPLTATAVDEHILSATTYSKSVLRAVAGQMAQDFADVDYFPSYEMIASPFSRGFFYEPNMRSVTTVGVETVMKVFFSQHRLADEHGEAKSGPRKGGGKRARRAANDADDVVCEEKLLEAFS